MAYTSHGHHIPGTVPSGPIPRKKWRCGSVYKCDVCKEEAVEILGHEPIDAMEISIKNVPIRYNGVIVGSANVTENGKIDIQVNPRASKEFMDTIGYWLGNGFSIYPNTTLPQE